MKPGYPIEVKPKKKKKNTEKNLQSSKIIIMKIAMRTKLLL